MLRHTRIAWGIGGLTFIMTLAWLSVGAQPKQPPPTHIGNSCQTAQCHANMGKQGTSIHRPVKFQKCTFCHQQLRPRLHKFKPVDTRNQACFTCHRSRPGMHQHRKNTKGWNCLKCHSPHQSQWKKLLRKPARQLCRSCHQSYHRKLRITGASIHKPSHQGQCLSCHRPHLPSPRRNLLRRASHKLCASCHQKELLHIRTLAHKHPKIQTQCTSCHVPHRSRHPKLLRREGNSLCLHCHKDLKTSKKHKQHLVSLHKPVQEACTKCHMPHGSAHKDLLTKPANELCLSCHQKSFAEHHKARSAHPITSPGSCLKCHEAHHSRHPKLQRQAEAKLCLSCHNRPIRGKDGRMIQDIHARVTQLPSPHKPVRQGRCSTCHRPHHSQQQQLLKQPLAATFYVPFSQKQYKLCFTCHSPKLASLKHTRKHTRFRDGSLNLHFIHVNKTRRGRNCSVCHDAHASVQAALVRKRVPYGKVRWMLPIRFSKHARGGTCVSGCHVAKTYRITRR